jgi:hypothetical protein
MEGDTKHQQPTKSKRLSIQLPPVNDPPQSSSPPDEPPGIRQRLGSMIFSPRHSPSDQAPERSVSPPKESARYPTSSAYSAPHHKDETPQVQHSSHHGFTMVTESLSPTAKTTVEHKLNPLRPAEVVHEEYHPTHTAPHLHLPGATADFLQGPTDRSAKTTTASIETLRTRRHNPDINEGKLHHLDETVVVRPPGIDWSAGTKHEVRRPSVWSSDSQYSASSYETEGTVDSDDEARDLLAHADSGPLPVHHAEADRSVAEPAPPSADQVKRAKEVLMKK